MKTSPKGLELIKASEALRLTAYLCPAGKWTIGWGHIEGVTRGMKINRERAEEFLAADLAKCENTINSSVVVDLKQHQFDALASFIFNIGVGGFKKSTLLKFLNQGKYDAVPAQLMRWTKHKEKTTGITVESNGLMRRRRDEAALWRGIGVEPQDNDEPLPQDVAEPQGKPLVESSTAWASGVSGLAAVGSVAKQVQEATENINGFLQGIIASPLFWLSLAAVGAAIWIIKERKRVAKEFGA